MPPTSFRWRIGKHQVFGIFVCISILSIQTIDAFLWREDYPFTKWGMYHRLHPFEPYINFEVRAQAGKRPISHLIKNPWMLRERIWSLYGIGTPVDPFDKDIETYLQMVRKNSELEGRKLKSLLAEFLWNPAAVDRVEVVFVAWRKLDYSNIDKPDLRFVVFPEPQ